VPHLQAGAERAGRTLADLDLQINATVEVGDDVDTLIAKYRPMAAFTLGAMGSAKTNFYNAAYSRAGWAEMAEKVQSLWVAGDKPGAIAAVEAEFVLAALFIGTESMVTQRIQETAAAGINTLRLAPVGRSSSEQIGNLENTVSIIRNAVPTNSSPV
jgi:alkanesulfonate monooxygenase SsuD/methylene tetrahydromethanopterin reductase-like flavin-dependent oxidoreductase (luciferase family)